MPPRGQNATGSADVFPQASQPDPPTDPTPSSHDLRAEYDAVCERDRDKYHGGPSGSQKPQAGPIGMPGPDGELYCVGCWWCCGDFEEWAGPRIAEKGSHDGGGR